MKSVQNLNRLVCKTLDINENLNWKIYNQNKLDFYKTHFGYIDFIVGNPTYIRIHNLDIKTKEILKKDFLFSEGTIDIYLSFFEMSLKMLKKMVFWSTPNSYLPNSSYNSFREYLLMISILKLNKNDWSIRKGKKLCNKRFFLMFNTVLLH